MEPAMSLTDQDAALSGCLRTGRILIGALALGVLTFLGLAVFVRQSNPAPVPDMPFLTYVALAVGALQAVLQGILPGLIGAGLRRQIAAGKWPPARPGQSVPPSDRAKLCALYLTRLIVGAALVEGAALLLLIAYLVEGSVLTLAGAGLMLAMLLVKFPTRPGLEGWLPDQEELLRRERMPG
jgi:hypothetical protein